ncbi:MAG: endolytic transglycosylase MltG [Candidatus Buchananbacteria bacterium]|nr:endolytic transglycosylase MltG [Candidatus Buchananbacteria bacterium]
MADMFGRRREKKIGKKLSFFFLLVILIFVSFYFVIINSKNSNRTEITEFVIQPGEGSTIIAKRLKQEHLIKSVWLFELYAWSHGIDSKLKDGNYSLAQNLTIKQMAEILSRGISIKEKTLTFIEGWNNQQYVDYLVKQDMVDSQDQFFDVVQHKASWWDNYNILDDKPKSLDLEGYLFPDTYRVYESAVVQDVIEKMLNNLAEKITPEMQAEIAKQGKTIHEILTLASILEKEVSTDYDRAMVADIFYKRIKIGMPLQADSTVNYATGKSESRSTIVDTKIDNPYNTYKYKGLPPGPICNPGLSAIKAAIYPTNNSYYYFLTTPDGEVIYNKTHDEHVAAKAKYYK